MTNEKYNKFKKAQRIVAWILAMLVLLFVDLLTKLLAENFLVGEAERIPLIPGFLELYFTRNYAIAFGIGEGNKVFMICVTVITVLMVGVIFVLSFTIFRQNKPARVALAFVEAGAVGNLIDRLVLGYVRDFLNMEAFKPLYFINQNPFNFGVCNIADYFITMGGVALVFIILFIGSSAVFPLKKKWREEAKKREEEEARHAKK